MNPDLYPMQAKGGAWLPNQKPLYSPHLYVDDERCVACWLFNESGGNTIHDISIMGRHSVGFLNAPSWTRGLFGSGIVFDGINQRINIGTIAILSSPPITIVAWALTPTTGATQTIFGICDNVGTNDRYTMIRIAADDKIGALANDGAGSRADTQTAPAVNTWFQASAVFASTTSRTAYLNGVPGTENTVARTPANLDKTEIGNTNDDSGPRFFWDGEIDHIRVYDAVLTDAEIEELYHNPFHDIKELRSVTYFVPAAAANLSAIYYRTLLQGGRV